MDCVDCHNRATHIYQEPSRAVDEAIRLRKIDRTLPYVRREALCGRHRQLSVANGCGAGDQGRH